MEFTKRMNRVVSVFLGVSLFAAPAVALADPFHSGRGWQNPGPGQGQGRGRPPEHARRRPVPAPRPVYRDREDEAASRLVREASGDLRCEQLSELYRRVAQRVLLTDSFSDGRMSGEDRSYYRSDDGRRGPGPAPRPPRGGEYRHHPRRDWGPMHWERLWERLGEAVRACEVDCFEEGEEIGQLSAAGYCSVSVALGGLDSPGRIAQPPLPMCSSAAWAGCTSSYRETVRDTEGCSEYSVGRFEGVFEGFVTQDCRMETANGG